MPLYEPVARYHVPSTDSPDYSDDGEDDDDQEVDERRSFISYRGNLGTRRIPNAHVVSNMPEEVDPNLELDGNRPRKINPLTIIQVKNPDKNVDDGDSLLSGLLNPILAMSANTSGPRKICCAAVSTVLCIAVSVGLISMSTSLPCSGRPDCAAAMTSSRGLSSLTARFQTQKQNQRQWNRAFDDISFSSGLQVVIQPKDVTPENVVLVSGFRSSTSSPNSGILAIDVFDGSIRWKKNLFAPPTKHDCHLVDLNEDDTKDCLVVGSRGLVAAINPKDGEELWYLLYHIPLVNVSLPRKLPDLDGDGINDLVAACAVTLPSEVNDQHPHPRTNFILISGKTGTILGRPYLFQPCTDISPLNVTSELSLRFDCTSEIGPDQFEMSLEELYLKVTNEHLPLRVRQILPDPPSTTSEWRQFEQVGEDSDETVKDSIHLDWVYYYRHCPECGVRVKLWDGFAHRILWNRSWANAIAFQPRSTRYETDRWDSPIEGFVFRLWQWENPLDTFTLGKKLDDTDNEITTTQAPTTKSRSADNPEDDSEEIYRRNNPDDDYNGDDDSMRGQASPYEWISNLVPFGHPNLGGRHILSMPSSSRDFKRRRRAIPSSRSGSNKNSVQGEKSSDDSSRILNVTETLYYATLNHTNPQLVQLFSQDLLQKCELTQDKKTYSCMPHYDTQANSMVILDRQDDPDSRDLIFATQTLVKETVKKSPDHRKAGKKGTQLPELETKWTLRTNLRKLSISKDILVVPHL